MNISSSAAFLLDQRGFMIDAQAFLTGRHPARRTRSEQLLCETRDDFIVHVEVKGKRKGSRRERMAKR